MPETKPWTSQIDLSTPAAAAAMRIAHEMLLLISPLEKPSASSPEAWTPVLESHCRLVGTFAHVILMAMANSKMEIDRDELQRELAERARQSQRPS